MLYSVIIPVYNRPNEIHELLESLILQTESGFEVLIIEDGSTQKCDHIVEKFKSRLDIRYFYKENSGQGFSRNFGFSKANGDYFVVFDSDCIIPPHYFEAVTSRLSNNEIDCWGGPDRAHSSFTPIQKAINYSMTSFFTTGGMRGSTNSITEYHPRSFNMGISKKVYEKTGGYRITRMGEDIEFSIRIQNHGFQTVFIENAFVYHKRRTNFKQFFKQLHFFGRARINIKRFYPDSLKPIHFFPLLFTAGLIISFLCAFSSLPIISSLIFLYLVYALFLFADAYLSEKNAYIALLATIAGFIQLTAYGIGLTSEMWRELKEKR